MAAKFCTVSPGKIAFCIAEKRRKMDLWNKKRLARFGLKILAKLQEKQKERKRVMLAWTVIFLIIALIAGVLGFGGIAGVAVGVARVLFFIFIVLFVASLVLRLING